MPQAAGDRRASRNRSRGSRFILFIFESKDANPRLDETEVPDWLPVD